MINSNMKNAMREVLEYLKGIRQEDLDKISPKFMNFLEKNASKDYKPNFDYTKPLSELKLMGTSNAIICYICYKYWCEDEKQKQEFYNLLKDNNRRYKEDWKEKSKNMFKSKENYTEFKVQNIKLAEEHTNKIQNKNELVPKKRKKIKIFSKIKEFIKNIIKRKGDKK